MTGRRPDTGNRRPALAVPYEAPRTQLETALAGIWAEILEIDEVGINDRFLDLGGHSLQAMRIFRRMGEELLLEVPLRILFDSPTVADMAAAVIRFRAEVNPMDELESLLDEIESLSDEEIADQLGKG